MRGLIGLAERNDRKAHVYQTAHLSGGGLMEKADPKCPDCDREMTFYSSETFTEHYICPDCNRFLVVQRPLNFYSKNPFKPRRY